MTKQDQNLPHSISGRVDKVTTTEKVNSGSIFARFKSNIIKTGTAFAASLLDVQQKMGQCEATAACDRQAVGGSLTRRLKGPFAVPLPRQLGE